MKEMGSEDFDYDEFSKIFFEDEPEDKGIAMNEPQTLSNGFPYPDGNFFGDFYCDEDSDSGENCFDEEWIRVVRKLHDEGKSFTYEDITRNKESYYAFMQYIDCSTEDFGEKIKIVNDFLGNLLKRISELYQGSSSKEQIETFIQKYSPTDNNILYFPFSSEKEMYEKLEETRPLYPDCWSLDDIVLWVKLMHLYMGFSAEKEDLRIEEKIQGMTFKPVMTEYLYQERDKKIAEFESWIELLFDGYGDRTNTKNKDEEDFFNER